MHIIQKKERLSKFKLIDSDPTVRKRRKAAGGNGSKQFVEGWVEFADKKIAKKVAGYLIFSTLGNLSVDYRLLKL